MAARRRESRGRLNKKKNGSWMEFENITKIGKNGLREKD